MSGIAYQCYCPEKDYSDEELFAHLRNKVTKDVGKLIDKDNAKRLKQLGVHQIKEWHFVTPEYKDKRIIEHLEKKRKEVVIAASKDPKTFSYIDPQIRLVPKIAEDFKIELIRLIRNPLVDIKLNMAVKSVSDPDWAACPAEKIDNIKEYVVKFLKRQLLFQEFYALKNVSLQIRKGEAWGLVGHNGAGKSTLLKLISGILKPYQGTVCVSGSISPLIELGAGFDSDMTARENIYLNGAVLGYPQKLIREKFEEIVDFAELWEFLDVPLKNFSTGMVSRLGFSIATIVKPEILIVDEALSVGDLSFQNKCERRIHALLEHGTTLLYVSHSVKSVMQLCTRAVWLEHGQIQMQGDCAAVCEAYIRSV